MRKLINYFHNLLMESDEFLGYLKKRKFSIDTIKKFKIGKFPEEPVNTLKYSNAEFLIKKSEILYRSFNGFDSMFSRNKLIIPIYDTCGKPIGIAGRLLVSEEIIQKHNLLKYINSKGYSKKNNLFGLHFAKETIRKKNEAFVVEGYFDVISAHQAGFNNVVASCGTAFGNGQVNLLSRYTDNINILFDNDSPGKRAAQKVMEKKENKKRTKIINKEIRKFNDLDEALCSGEDIRQYIV